MDNYRKVIAYDTCKVKDMDKALVEGWQPWGSAYVVTWGKHDNDFTEIQPVVQYEIIS